MASRRRKRSADEVSATPEAQAVRRAVRLLGGAAAVGSIVNRCAQAVQKWTENPTKMSPTFARVLSRATGHVVTVTEMRPDVFGDLSVQELGYLPKSYSDQQPPSSKS
jgi:DNA-binding transcriptional regulator YdaS (Cro superfamily)